MSRKRAPGSKAKKSWRRDRRPARPTRNIEQPVADFAGAVPCTICGFPVDPKRMHFHMVRVHGASFRASNS